MKLAVIFAACVALACCTPSAPPPSSDAGSATTALPDDVAASCAAACARLAALGCPEGGAPCPATCEHAQRARLTDLHPGCLARARTAAEVRACGSVACSSP